MAKNLQKMLLNKAKTKMTDKDFFMSQTMVDHFEKIIEGVCKSYNRTIHIIILDEGSFVAYTNGNTITVNISSEWIRMQETRIAKYYLIVGIILHECAHILYTDFELLEKSNDSLVKNVLYPKINISDELTKVLDANKGKKLISIYGSLSNCIEDGYIEKRVMQKIPGYGECLHKVRKIQLASILKSSYEDDKRSASEKGLSVNKVSCLTYLVLTYAKFGVDNTGGTEDDLTETFIKMKSIIDRAVVTNNPILRQKEINRVFDILIQFISKELLEEDKKKDDRSEEDESGENEKSSDSDDTSSKEYDSSTAEDNTSSEKDITNDLDDTTDDVSNEGLDSLSEEEKDTFDDMISDLTLVSDELNDSTEHRNMECNNPIGEYADEPSNEFDSEKNFDSEYSDGPEEWDLSYLEDKVSEEIVSKVIKKQIVAKMKETSISIRKERIDKYPSVEEYAEADSEAVFMYNCEHEELDRIARRTAKNLDKVLKERQKGDKCNGLYTGKYLDTAHTYRKDRKVFANKILPEDIPDMEVCVLVDCSGSMSAYNRMVQSRKCAYITWKFCKIMNIRCSVYGHTTTGSYDKVLMTCVAHPDNMDNKDAQRIFMLRPLSNNRDGWALNFCAYALSKSSAKTKLLLVISDGIPAARGYGLSLGKMDCQEVVSKYKKKGINIITAGIDSSADDIRSVYLDGADPREAAAFLDYSDMTLLPKAFATLLKKELL